MTTHRTHLTSRLAAAVAAALLSLTLTAGPVVATEGESGEPATEQTDEGEQTGEGSDEPQKITLPEDPHDRVGLILLGLTALGGLLALENARRQLRGERSQATGEWRWR